jgi:hypothetical protein
MIMNSSWSDHVFAVTAYKESPFLRACLESLQAQTLASRIIMTTATPNDSIKSLAEEFSVPLFINDHEPGIATDWNFAVNAADAPYVTIAHQDDIYCPEYAQHAHDRLAQSNKPLIFFTNYGELRDDVQVDDNELLAVKRRLLTPLRSGRHAGSVFVRRRVLSLGSAICCPSVTLAVDNLPSPVFTPGMKSNLDWEAWARLAKLSGDFLYDDTILMYHRIHQGSETSSVIAHNGRTSEDYQMFHEFWPAPIAHAINAVYSRGQKSNTVDAAK